MNPDNVDLAPEQIATIEAAIGHPVRRILPRR
jgi:hypothetical protein